MENQRQHLPMELILIIFNKLPVKSLCRFKCVSTYLHSYIKDPTFVNSRPKTLTQLQTIHNSCKELGICSIDQNGSATRTRYFVFRHDIFNSKHVNGLICYCDNMSRLGLFNPTTEELIPLPRSPFRSGFDFEFGFHPKSDEYKILAWKYNAGNPLNFHVFTLEKHGSWKPIKNNIGVKFIPKMQYFPQSSTNVNGSLFWFDGEEENIIFFNLSSEEFGIVQLPIKTDTHYCKYTIFDFEGGLCLAEQPRSQLQTINLWKMKDMVNSVWVLMLKNVIIPFEDTTILNRYSPSESRFSVVCGQNGEIMTLKVGGGNAYIFSYNVLNGQLRKTKVDDEQLLMIRSTFFVRNHIENYLSLEQFVPSSNKVQQTTPYWDSIEEMALDKCSSTISRLVPSL